MHFNRKSLEMFQIKRKYCQTCEQRPCKGKPKTDLSPQVIFIQRAFCYNSWHVLNTWFCPHDDLYLEGVFSTGLTVFAIPKIFVRFCFGVGVGVGEGAQVCRLLKVTSYH